ncbi:sodium:proton antiporter [Nocardia yunnanensis]|uniref:Sodium:proton antiporter n=1 Tax=Nocardia yunnanensis TaxID=2382165 RepID=A0A386ZE87_9NOCA|nr:DUF6328 family protein [Nocardia yunnanensis]AYF75846.1 sodium:proton antiporter [Nocardia yunnanensis]
MAAPAPGAGRDGRSETTDERLDRNWNSLMQELRVTQTGVQLLTGFLLTLPFQNRFGELSTAMRWLYLAIVAASIGATACLIAPVAAHRMLFRRHRIGKVVTSAHRYALAGLGLLGLALVGVPILIFDTVAGLVPAIVVGVVSACLFTWVWWVHPWRQRPKFPR